MSNADAPTPDVITTDAITDTPPAAAAASTANEAPPSMPVLALPAALPRETHALLEMIGRGLAPDADDSARHMARELWARFAQTLATVAPMPLIAAGFGAPPLPGATPMPDPVAIPALSVPTSPLGVAARALKQMTPDQLLDLVLQRLRAALPAGATIPVPRGIQFPLLPMQPHGR